MLRQVSLKLEVKSSVQEIARKNNANIRVVDCKDLNKKDTALLLDVSTRDGRADEVIAELNASRIIKKAYVGEAEGQPSRSLGVVVMKRPDWCQAVSDCGAFCLSCPISSSGDGGVWKLLIRDSEQLKTLMDRLQELGVRASVAAVSDLERDDRLTSRQSEILAKAISAGYFEFPRRISLTELSKLVGIKPSTLSQVLRSAEEKIMARYVEEAKVGQASLMRGEALPNVESQTSDRGDHQPSSPFES